jgi:hypothetical protein
MVPPSIQALAPILGSLATNAPQRLQLVTPGKRKNPHERHLSIGRLHEGQ